jgi:DMSO/TMAO reductase YedYZ molybdopterin-dependent catalytic subunit
MGRRTAILHDPYNAEAPLDVVDGGPVASGDFFVRSHFAVPEIDSAAWRCPIVGAVLRPVALDLETLRALPRRQLAVTLECAGNGRTLLRPEVKGAPWSLGAVSTATFTGVALKDVLDRAGIGDDAVEVVCRGADSGTVPDGRRVSFERSLPLDVARDPDVLVAWGMNGAPLPPEHGAPVRLIVPGWYGVASVKWLVGLRVATAPFAGYFQGESYVYRGCAAYAENAPVGPVRVRALIASPVSGAHVARGAISVSGSAWSGSGAIANVEISTDDAESWRAATLDAPSSTRAATPWHAIIRMESSGEVEILARATDAAGNVQPLVAPWNVLGYGNNAVQRVRVIVDPS